jgi:probable HAF family extracellular repeat protein
MFIGASVWARIRVHPMKTQPTNINIMNRILTVTLAAGFALAASSAAAQSYIVSDLGVLPDQQYSEPAAINNKGDVAGTSGQLAFRYSNSDKVRMDDAAKYSKGTARAFGINDSGLLVGDSTFGLNFSRAAVFSNGTATDLGTLKSGGSYSRANDINSFGEVVGFASQSRDSSAGRAFFRNVADRFSMIDLGTLGGAYAQAWAINDSGAVTGNSEVLSRVGATHAFIWTKKAPMRDLGTLGGDFSYGAAINADNHIAGYSTVDKTNDRIHAFLHDGKVMHDLGSLSTGVGEVDRSYALGVNSTDQVVGYTYQSATPEAGSEVVSGPYSVGFVYSKGVMQNLNSLIGEDAKEYRLDRATAINDAGQIVAVAFVNSVGAYHAVLLTPATNGGLAATR